MLVFFLIFTSSSYFGAVLEKAHSAGDLVLDKHLLYTLILVSMYNMALFGKKHTASTSLQTPQNAPKKFPFSATAPIIFGFSFINFLRKKNIYF